MAQIKNGVFQWHSRHNSIFLFCFAIVLLSCHGNKKSEIKKEPLEIENTIFNETDTVIKEENRALKDQERDTISEEKLNELAFLKSKDLIPSDFKHNKAVFFKNYRIRDISYSLLKIEYSPTIGEKYLQDPYINFIYVKSGSDLVKYIVLYSIEEEDIDFAFNLGENIFFEQYDSSTGWKKYVTFLKSQSKFIESDRIDEAEDIVQSSINLKELTYRTILDNEIKKFRIIN